MANANKTIKDNVVLKEQSHAQGRRKIKKDINTFSPAEMFVLPSASLAERAPMPIDGKTIHKNLQ